MDYITDKQAIQNGRRLDGQSRLVQEFAKTAGLEIDEAISYLTKKASDPDKETSLAEALRLRDFIHS